MSREFGGYDPGYFHNQMERAADDCLQGRDKMTRLWGEFLAELKDVAWAISSSEAGDSNECGTIFATIEALPKLSKKIVAIESHILTYKRIAESAIASEALKNRNSK